MTTTMKPHWLGLCDKVLLGHPCGVPVTREGYPPHGGPVTSTHGWLSHTDGMVGGGRHSPTLTGVPSYVPGPRCTVPGHDH